MIVRRHTEPNWRKFKESNEYADDALFWWLCAQIAVTPASREIALKRCETQFTFAIDTLWA